MSVRRLIVFLVFFFSISFLFPKTSRAFDLQESLTSENSIVVKIQEGLEYFFAFKVENKVAVLDKHAEKRLVMADKYAEEGNNDRVDEVMQNYSEIKDKQNNLLEKIDDEGILQSVAERTIEQQKTMEQVKLRVDGDTKQNMVQTQERVVNQVAKRVIDVGGAEGATEFLNGVAHVWAPGTGPDGGEAGVVYAGGGKLIYAPGTSAGGGGGVVIEGGTIQFAPGTSAGGGGGGTTVVEGGNQGSAPSGGTTVEGGGGGGLAPGTTNTIDPGGLAPGTSENGDTWLAP